MERYGKLFSLCQRESMVKEFAHQFIIAAEGLNHTALKDIFNSALNEPVSDWEMRMLGFSSFWGFVGFVYSRGGEGDLPPLGPPPLSLTNSQVPSPLITLWGKEGEGTCLPHLPPTQWWRRTLQLCSCRL